MIFCKFLLSFISFNYLTPLNTEYTSLNKDMIHIHLSITYAEVTKFTLAFIENDPDLHSISSRR